MKENALLEWGTTNEINSGFFTIEKSKNGVQYETLAIVNAIKEKVTAQLSYTYTDHQPNINGYYRISQTDNDGAKNYFSTIQVKTTATKNIKARAYVKQSYIYVQTSGNKEGIGSIELYDIEGKKVSTKKIVFSSEIEQYKIEKPRHAGIYILRILRNGEKPSSLKIMVP